MWAEFAWLTHVPYGVKILVSVHKLETNIRKTRRKASPKRHLLKTFGFLRYGKYSCPATTGSWLSQAYFVRFCTILYDLQVTDTGSYNTVRFILWEASYRKEFLRICLRKLLLYLAHHHLVAGAAGGSGRRGGKSIHGLPNTKMNGNKKAAVPARLKLRQLTEFYSIKESTIADATFSLKQQRSGAMWTLQCTT